MASVKLQPPDLKGKTYERFKTELTAWSKVAGIEKKKQGFIVALSLDEDHSGIREKVFDELNLDSLEDENGLKKLLEFMDLHLGKDDLADSLEKFEDFDDCVREEGQSISDFISRFDQKYNRIAKLDMKLPSPILAFQLIRKAKISKEERLLVLTGVNLREKVHMYEQAKESLKKFKGEVSSGFKSQPIKLEPAYLAKDNVLMASGYSRGRGKWNKSARGNGYYPTRGGNSGGYRQNMAQASRGRGKPSQRSLNPIGVDGQPILCRACGSYRHLIASCPDSWENSAQANVVADGVPREQHINEAVLFTGNSRNSMTQLGDEARNCVVLDSACSSTVCGERWMQAYLESLDERDKEKIEIYPGKKVFKFGGDETLKSLASYKIPAVMAGKAVMIQTDVVTSGIPLLLSKDAMKKAKVKMNLENDTAEIFGVNMALNHTSAGHYCIPIDRMENLAGETVHMVRLSEMNEGNLLKVLTKLHRQFAHPPVHKLKALMDDAGSWNKEYEPILVQIQEECELCKQYARTPPRPVVALPMARDFNEKVAMDLKKWKDKWILHIIDMWSRLTISKFISRKKPSEVIDTVMMYWVGAGFGVMRSILTDNGGEFSSDEIRDVASVLNITVCTTAAESPFQNGLCERNHAVTDHMLMKLVAEFPTTPQEVLLAWANNAKNSLQMWHGFSSFQLVLGRNPNLPNIMSDTPPSMESTTSSKCLAQHLNALHEARKAFMESESSERIRRALRSKIRASEEKYNHGDIVYYKREAQDRWLGPAKVMFEDRKVVFVRHGGTFVRVSPNRLNKAGNGVQTSDKLPENDSLGNGKQGRPEEKEQIVKEQNSKELMEVILSPDQSTDDTKVVDNNRLMRHGQIRLQKDDKVQYQISPEGEWTQCTVLGRAGKATGQNYNWYNVKDLTTGEEKSIDFNRVESWHKVVSEEVNIVTIPRSRHGEEDCKEAKQAEMIKLQSFDTYEEVPDEGQFRISTTWVLWKKGQETRARLVARGFEDISDYRKDSPTMAKSTMRTILAITASQGWLLKATDVKSAFLQGKEMEREVFLKPPPEAAAGPQTLWRLKHCLYGLNDAARHFYQSVRDELIKLGCQQSTMDPSCFCLKDKGQLIGVIGCHIDDFLHAGEDNFEKLVMEPLRKRFLAGKVEEVNVRYVGFDIKQIGTDIIMDQTGYIHGSEGYEISPKQAADKREENLTQSDQTVLRQIVGKLNWIVQGTRPDIAFEMISLSTKLKKGKGSDLIQAFKCMRRLRDEQSYIKFSRMRSYQKWRIIVFTDAALANLEDSGSVAGHIVFLVDDKGSSCVLNWQANKIRRIVRSTLAAETMALIDGVSDAQYMRKLLDEMTGRKDMTITAITDNKSVLEAINSTRMVDDKRLRIDLAALKETIIADEHITIEWCPGTRQLADSLTKRGASSTNLLQVLQSGKLCL